MTKNKLFVAFLATLSYGQTLQDFGIYDKYFEDSLTFERDLRQHKNFNTYKESGGDSRRVKDFDLEFPNYESVT